jgi:hypothetical protein
MPFTNDSLGTTKKRKKHVRRAKDKTKWMTSKSKRQQCECQSNESCFKRKCNLHSSPLLKNQDKRLGDDFKREKCKFP